MLIRLKNCEAVECAYIALVIQIYKDKNELGDGAKSTVNILLVISLAF